MSLTNDITEKFRESLEKFVHAAQEPIRDFLSTVDFESIQIELPKPLSAIIKIKKCQYVISEYLSYKVVDSLIDSKEVEKTLLEYESKDNYSISNRIIEGVGKCDFFKDKLVLVQQTKKAYNSKLYNVAALGILALIDNALTVLSGDSGPSGWKRCEKIYKKLRESRVVTDDEIWFFGLSYTYAQTFKTLYEHLDFDGNEPKYINRNWVMHGSSTRVMSRMDCIKLFRFLYGLIKLNECERKSNEES